MSMMSKRIRNIGPEGQKTRLRGGLAALLAALFVGSGLWIAGVSRWWRLFLFLPFWQAALGVSQALNKT